MSWTFANMCKELVVSFNSAKGVRFMTTQICVLINFWNNTKKNIKAKIITHRYFYLFFEVYTIKRCFRIYYLYFLLNVYFFYILYIILESSQLFQSCFKIFIIIIFWSSSRRFIFFLKYYYDISLKMKTGLFVICKLPYFFFKTI